MWLAKANWTEKFKLRLVTPSLFVTYFAPRSLSPWETKLDCCMGIAMTTYLGQLSRNTIRLNTMCAGSIGQSKPKLWIWNMRQRNWSMILITSRAKKSLNLSILFCRCRLQTMRYLVYVWSRKAQLNQNFTLCVKEGKSSSSPLGYLYTSFTSNSVNPPLRALTNKIC